jgi:hypothetical protein
MVSTRNQRTRAASSPPRRHPEAQHAHPRDQQPDRGEHQGQREEPRQELPEQQRVAVDRLGQQARHRALVELAIHHVEGQGAINIERRMVSSWGMSALEDH